jgi:hypothetical protein
MSDYIDNVAVRRRERLIAAFLEFEEECLAKGIQIMYENSINTASKIFDRFYNSEKPQFIDVLIAEMQSGKTATMCALIKQVINSHIPIKNIFVIGCLSDNQWLDDTKNRLPSKYVAEIYHRPQLYSKENAEKFKNLRDTLLIFDEAHLACKKNQTFSKFLTDVGLTKDYCMENNVRILEVSATPDGVLEECIKLGYIDKPTRMDPGEGYTGIKFLKENNRLREYKDLCPLDKDKIFDSEKFVENVKDLEECIFSFGRPLYHIIRTKGPEMETALQVYFEGRCNFINFNCENKETLKLNNVKNNFPDKHTIIFIKEFWRQAKTLCEIFGGEEEKYIKNIGVLYDRYAKVKNDSSLCQSLVGRACGYNRHNAIIFTNSESVNNYLNAWERLWENIENWKSNTLKVNAGKRNLKPTKIGSMSPTRSVSENNGLQYTLEWFETHDQAKNYIKETLDVPRGPNKRTQNQNGFIEATIKKQTKVWSFEEINNNVWKGDANNKYWYYPCYTDITDNSTLRFVVIHRKID